MEMEEGSESVELEKNVNEKSSGSTETEQTEAKQEEKEPVRKTLVGGAAEAEEESKEEKNGEEEPADEEKEQEEEQEGAPEEYGEFVFSEGFEADKELLGEFTELAKEHNLPQDEAQKYTAMGEKVAKKAYSDAYKKQSEAWDMQQEKWAEEILQDPEIGRNDPKQLEKELAGCNAVLGKFGDKEFREELADTGFGNNAGLVRMLHRISKATKSDTFVKGGGVSRKKSAAETWYGDK